MKKDEKQMELTEQQKRTSEELARRIIYEVSYDAATKTPSIQLISGLIEAGADVNFKDWRTMWSSWTPLRWAALNGHKDAAVVLIGAGADISSAFDTLDELEDLFEGDIGWIPGERLPEGWRKLSRSRGAFGRF
jgi:ankyrin repeat protein